MRVAVLVGLVASLSGAPACDRRPAPPGEPPLNPSAMAGAPRLETVADLVQLVAADVSAGQADAEQAAQTRAEGRAKPAPQLIFSTPERWAGVPLGAAAGATGPVPQRFIVPRAAGDRLDAELIVRPPSAAAPSVEALLSAWRRQVDAGAAQPLVDGQVRTEALEVNGLGVTLAEARSDLAATAAGELPRPQHFLAAFVSGPDGVWSFELSGPPNTVSEHRDAFLEMIRTLRVETGE